MKGSDVETRCLAHELGERGVRTPEAQEFGDLLGLVQQVHELLCHHERLRIPARRRVEIPHSLVTCDAREEESDLATLEPAEQVVRGSLPLWKQLEAHPHGLPEVDVERRGLVEPHPPHLVAQAVARRPRGDPCRVVPAEPGFEERGRGLGVGILRRDDGIAQQLLGREPGEALSEPAHLPLHPVDAELERHAFRALPAIAVVPCIVAEDRERQPSKTGVPALPRKPERVQEHDGRVTDPVERDVRGVARVQELFGRTREVHPIERVGFAKGRQVGVPRSTAALEAEARELLLCCRKAVAEEDGVFIGVNGRRQFF